MKRLLTLLAILTHWPAQATQPDWSERVLRVEVTRADGSLEIGSAVTLAGDRLVSNCHVLRDAARIQILIDGSRREALASRQDAYRDLCFLSLPGYDAPSVSMIDVGETRVGLDVVAVGWSGGKFSVRDGRIVGLYDCECDGGKVIQTTSPFDRGASGGGLFDRRGRLVGILTFKAQSGGNFHFALPVGWLRHLTDAGFEPMEDRQAFWEAPGRESGYFLAACDLGAKEDWDALHLLAEEWCEQQPHNPEAWMALGRALSERNNPEAAASAFQRVLLLDSTHAEAKWALQRLEFELERNLSSADGV